MKKITTINILKKILKDISVIRTGIDLIVSNQTLVKSINEQQDRNNWFKVTDNPKKKTSELIEECRKLFKVTVLFCNEYSIDELIPPPIESITRIFEESIEPTVLNVSYNEFIKKGIYFASLRERLIMEMQYFKETGKHLDIQNYTLTSTLIDKSRVAIAFWRPDGGQVNLSVYDPVYQVVHLGVRPSRS